MVGGALGLMIRSILISSTGQRSFSGRGTCFTGENEEIYERKAIKERKYSSNSRSLINVSGNRCESDC